jgi:SSS family transporter
MESLDLLVIIIYFIGITLYGLWISRKNRSMETFFRGGRKFKWWIMMGQAFGTGTHAEMPVAQAGAAFQGGFSTIWYQWKNLLITPFYWLIGPWYRRSERTTIAEMVTDRYGKETGLFYTLFAIVFFIFIMGSMLQGAAKVISVASGGAVSPTGVVIGMTVAFMIYSYFGGLVAAAHTEFIQGLLIIVLSFLLIPNGFNRIGGFSGMRDSLPSDFFKLFSEESGMGTFMILMLAINGIVGITAQPHMMSMFATGNSERAGRIGQTYGTFVKRLITIGWVLTGMVVAVIVIKEGASLEDPEHAFGYAARLLLAPGLTGLMIACILAANMSSCSNFMVNLGALFTKDVYRPYINKTASDQQMLKVGRISSLVLTLSGVLFAISIKNVLAAFLFAETIAAFMGILIVGGFLWKRANRYGAVSSVVLAFTVYYFLNYRNTGDLQLIYTWTPVPFGWAMLVGFGILIVVSLATPQEPFDKTAIFFKKMTKLSDTDLEKSTNPLFTVEESGDDLLFLDLPGWLKMQRWRNFWSRYREDLVGFILAWGFVAFLIFLAWMITSSALAH